MAASNKISELDHQIKMLDKNIQDQFKILDELITLSDWQNAEFTNSKATYEQVLRLWGGVLRAPPHSTWRFVALKWFLMMTPKPTTERVHGATMATTEEDARLNPYDIISDDDNDVDIHSGYFLMNG